MAFTLLVHASVGALGTATTSGIDTTGADLLVVSVGGYTGVTTGSVSDSVGGNSNTWTNLTIKTSTQTYSRISYCKPTHVGAGHTFTFSNGANIVGSIAAAAYSGSAASSPFDVENGAIDNGSVTSIQVGAVSPGQNNELVITSVCPAGVNDPATIDSSFTVIEHVPGVSGQYVPVGLAHLIQTTAGSVNPTWSGWANAGDVSAVIATFKAAAGAAPVIPWPFFNMMAA